MKVTKVESRHLVISTAVAMGYVKACTEFLAKFRYLDKLAEEGLITRSCFCKAYNDLQKTGTEMEQELDYDKLKTFIELHLKTN